MRLYPSDWKPSNLTDFVTCMLVNVLMTSVTLLLYSRFYAIAFASFGISIAVIFFRAVRTRRFTVQYAQSLGMPLLTAGLWLYLLREPLPHVKVWLTVCVVLSFIATSVGVFKSIDLEEEE